MIKNIPFVIYSTFIKIIQQYIIDIILIHLCIILYVALHWQTQFSLNVTYGGEFNPSNWQWMEDHLPFNSFWMGPGLNWPAHNRLGADGTMSTMTAVPYSIIALVQYLSNMSAISRNIIVESGTKTFGFLSTYLIFRMIYGQSWGAVIGSISYAWNSYFMVSWNGGQYAENIGAALIPLWFLIFFRAINGKKITFKHNFLMSVLVSFHPIFAFMCGLFGMQIYLILIFLKYKISTIRESYKKLAPSIVISLVMILPWIAGSAAISKSVTYPFEYNSIEMFRSLSKNTYTWLGALSLNHPFWPDIYSWTEYPLKDILLIRNLLPILISYFVLIIDKNKFTISLYSVYITSAFLAKGASGPFLEINEWIYINMPGMDYFRTSAKFSLICSLMAALLLAKIVNYYSSKFGKNTKYAIIVSSTWIFGFANLAPILFIDDNSRLNGSIPRIIEADSIAFDNELEKSGLPVRILVYPWGGETSEKSNSKQHVGLYNLAGAEWSKFVRPTGSNQDAFDYFFSTKMSQYIMQFSNIAYVIVPIDDEGYVFGRDGMGNGADAPGRSELARRLKSSPGLVEVEEPYRRLHVFKVVGPRSEAFLTDSIKEFDTATMAPDYDRSQSFTDPIMLAAVPNDAGSQGVRSIGNSRYIIDNNTKKSYFILSHNYSEDWHAFLFSKKQMDQDCGVWCRWSFENKGFMWWYFASNTLGVSEFIELDHFRVNGFAQGWRIPEGDEKLVVVEFKPQRAYEIGWLVSCSAGVCASLWLSIGYLKKYLLGHVTSA